MRMVVQVAFIVLGLAAAAALMLWDNGVPDAVADRVVPPKAIPLAVMGDSNSHAYQDRLNFSVESGQRGGIHQERTFNWVEVLARLRGDEIDVGPWVTWGRSGVMVRLLDLLHLPVGRAPRKEDYLYNFAFSAMGCKELMEGKFRQAPRLVALMDREPERWRQGVVVIRTGLGEWSQFMDLQAKDPNAPELQPVIDGCVKYVGDAIGLIHAAHPATRIVVVGVVNEASDPLYFDRWQNGLEFGNIEKALGRLNGALQRLADAQPNTLFFDDQAWVLARWGSRPSDGTPVYKTVTIGGTLRVTNTAGDSPNNAIMEDHHSGLAYNALWAQSLVSSLNAGFGLSLTPITDQEVARFVLPLADASFGAALRAPGS